MKKSLLFISLEHWNDIWRRNQFFAARMQKNFNVTFVGPVIPFWSFFKRKQEKYQKIKLKYIYKFLPDRFCRKLNEFIYTLQCPKKTDLLWINDHKRYFLLENIRYKKSIYDITDDWTIMTPLYKPMDEFLCKNSDVVIVCSKSLLKSRLKYTKNIFLVKNGINSKDYKIKKNAGEFFLYTGTLNEDRLDVNLMIELAQKFPKETFFYIGPDFMSKRTKQKLSLVNNIKIKNAIPYQKLSLYMSRAKALIVPHCKNLFVNSLDPIKQYEYMVSDKPVISTNVSGFNEWKDIFTIVNSKKEFFQAIKNVIESKIIVNVIGRKQGLKKSSWDNRYSGIVKILG